MPMLRAADMHELRLAHETANMILSAEMKLKALHYAQRGAAVAITALIIPNSTMRTWRAWINIYKGSDGSMKFEKQPFDSWPV